MVSVTEHLLCYKRTSFDVIWFKYTLGQIIPYLQCWTSYEFNAWTHKKNIKSLYGLLIICLQAYAPGPYGDYIAPPPHATQIVYSSDGQPYAVAYPYQYQGTSVHTLHLSRSLSSSKQ